jgi:hypothetical protein
VSWPRRTPLSAPPENNQSRPRCAKVRCSLRENASSRDVVYVVRDPTKSRTVRHLLRASRFTVLIGPLVDASMATVYKGSAGLFEQRPPFGPRATEVVRNRPADMRFPRGTNTRIHPLRISGCSRKYAPAIHNEFKYKCPNRSTSAWSDLRCRRRPPPILRRKCPTLYGYGDREAGQEGLGLGAG